MDFTDNTNNSNKETLLIVDDEPEIRKLLQETFEEQGYHVKLAKNSMEALDRINRNPPTVVLLDSWLRGSQMDGNSILQAIKQKYPSMPVVVMSGHGTIETAVTAVKLGAFDYIEKPFTQDKVIITIKNAIESARLKQENVGLKAKTLEEDDFNIYTSEAMKRFTTQRKLVAPSDGRVLISAQNGSGQEMVARMIHNDSRFAYSGQFIQFTPANKTIEEINEMLFSEVSIENMHRIRRPSLFEIANMGTLYIHGIEDLPLDSQKKLNEVLQRNIIINYSNNEEIKLDFRFICSTSKNLHDLTAAGKFSQSLLMRINLLHLKIPSIEERREDIPELIECYLKRISQAVGIKYKKFSRKALSLLQFYPKWQGLTHLKNVVEWCLLMDQDQGEYIQISALPKEVVQDNVAGFVSSDVADEIKSDEISLREATEVFQLDFILRSLSMCSGNVTKTANRLHIERSALHRKRKQLENKALKNPQIFGINVINLISKGKKTRKKFHIPGMFEDGEQSNSTDINVNNDFVAQVGGVK